MKTLILQVLGNSDVLVDSDEGASRLQTAYTVERGRRNSSDERRGIIT